ncbi:MAG: hypothetical protein COV44_06570 [Deltaproteobacteria bacterium CG11_big_fil_rev_8_21_14_0_20_45_16]|nr:MAG: hypothetical protein COV44_06570 [Deltaproteobacteria bacterium CG11_big_fil_rev_8_21_14_0_20_45_16]
MFGAINNSLFMSISRSLNRASQRASDSIQRLASGSRFVSPTDDPINQRFVERLDSQLRGMYQAGYNIDKTLGLVTEASNALQNMEDIATSLKDLATQAADSSISSEDRALIEQEADILMEQFQSYASNTSYDGFNLLNGSFGSKTVQTGANAGQNFSFSIGDARSTVLGKLSIISGAQDSGAYAIGDTNSLQINNVYINASTDDGYSTAGIGVSALSKANAINAKSNETGVKAEALATIQTLYSDFVGPGTYTGSLTDGDFLINGVSITGTIGDASQLADAINDHSSTTGVTASIDGSGEIILEAEDGRNIQLQISNASTNNIFDVFDISANEGGSLFDGTSMATLSSGSDGYATGAIQLYSSDRIVIGGTSPEDAIDITSGSYNLDAGTSFQHIDLSTADDASLAVKILESTVADISTLRANIDAVHSRLSSTANTLVQSETNLETTKEAVGGTDFALEIANLAMAQFLQDASVASLAQANVTLSKVQDLLEPLKNTD